MNAKRNETGTQNSLTQEMFNMLKNKFDTTVRLNVGFIKVNQQDNSYAHIALPSDEVAEKMAASFDLIKPLLVESNAYAGTVIVNKIEYGIIAIQQSMEVVSQTTGEIVRISPRIKLARINNTAQISWDVA